MQLDSHGLCDLYKATIELFFDGELKDLKGKSPQITIGKPFRQLAPNSRFAGITFHLNTDWVSSRQ